MPKVTKIMLLNNNALNALQISVRQLDNKKKKKTGTRPLASHWIGLRQNFDNNDYFALLSGFTVGFAIWFMLSIFFQPYRSYPYGSSDGRIPAQEYISPSNTLIGNVNQRQIVAGSQSIAPMPSISENQTLDHDLPTVFSRSDMQWLTTSSTDMRTQSPLNTSSPRSKMPPLYPSQPTPPNVSLLQQSSLDDSPSASLGRHQFRQQTTPGTSSQAAPSSRSKKASSSNPTKPKGTPGRKRKFQDHEVRAVTCILLTNNKLL